MQLHEQNSKRIGVERVRWEGKVHHRFPFLRFHFRRRPIEMLGLAFAPVTPHHRASVFDLLRICCDRVAQIDNLNAAFTAAPDEQKVRRAEVSVYQSEGSKVLERLDKLLGDRDLLLHVEGRVQALLGAPAHALVKGPSRHELHDHIWAASARHRGPEALPAEVRGFEHSPLCLEAQLRRPMARVILEVSREPSRLLRAIPLALRVVQPLQGPLRLAVQDVGMSELGARLRRFLDLRDLNGDLRLQAAGHVRRPVHSAQRALAELRDVIPSANLVMVVVRVRQRVAHRAHSEHLRSHGVLRLAVEGQQNLRDASQGPVLAASHLLPLLPGLACDAGPVRGTVEQSQLQGPLVSTDEAQLRMAPRDAAELEHDVAVHGPSDGDDVSD
mmetsp:Transcript_95583/g.275405  ORF Transcript_95583/g.275405 Transcript_95583/m.275405 type:complete len:386 (+) Transcript_95583:616-1773(+)